MRCARLSQPVAGPISPRSARFIPIQNAQRAARRVSRHLNVLKEAGLVSERRNGTRRMYRARPEGLAELKDFLEEFWDVRLEALKREAEKEERKKHGHKD